MFDVVDLGIFFPTHKVPFLIPSHYIVSASPLSFLFLLIYFLLKHSSNLRDSLAFAILQFFLNTAQFNFSQLFISCSSKIISSHLYFILCVLKDENRKTSHENHPRSARDAGSLDPAFLLSSLILTLTQIDSASKTTCAKALAMCTPSILLSG